MSKSKFDTGILTTRKKEGSAASTPPAAVLASQQLASATPTLEPFPFQSQQIPLSDIKPNPDQPRKTFDPESIKELAESIDAIGLIQPIVVVRRSEHYTIIAGERRFQAHQKLGRNSISCIVRPASKEERDELLLALTENVQRENLKPIEEARAIQNTMAANDLSQVAMAKQLGKSRKYIQDLLAVLDKLDGEQLTKADDAGVAKSALVDIATSKEFNAAERQALLEKATANPKRSWTMVQQAKERKKREPTAATYRSRTTFEDLPGSVTVSIPKDPDSVTADEVLMYLQKAVDELTNQAPE